MRFWDSSAIVPLLVSEAATDSLRGLYASYPGQTVWCLTRLFWQWREPSPASGTPFSATTALRTVFQVAGTTP